MIRVLVVHEDAGARRRFREVLEAAADIAVVGAAADAAAALAVLRAQPVDVIVMGPAGPPQPETPPCAGLVEARSPVSIFVASPGRADRGQLVPGRAAAAAYLCEQAAAVNLCAAVRAVHAGEAYVCPYLADVPEPVQRPENAELRLRRLSPRERELFRYLAAGRSNRQIAAALGLSPKTVAAHRMHILAKLGLRTNIDLARLAFERGLLKN